MTPSVAQARALYRAPADRVAYVDVPELTCLTLTGEGAPEDAAFAEAAEALFAVSSSARFVAKRRIGLSSRAMPLEALWWSDASTSHVDLVAALALGLADVRLADRRRWRWQALMVQPRGVDEAVFEQAVSLARRREVPRVEDLRLEVWREGPAAQLLHTGSYAGAARTVTRLHEAVEESGFRLTGRHHEIYLTDPRHTERDAMRMVLRRPVERD